MAILQIIDQLADKLNNSPKMPLSSNRLVDANEISRLLEQLRISVPSSIMESERTLQDRERILAEAEMDAKKIVAQARQKANEILSSDGLVAMARKEADRIVEEGRQQARQRAEEADAYSVEKLEDLGGALKRMLAEVDNGLNLLRSRTRTMAERQPGPNARDAGGRDPSNQAYMPPGMQPQPAQPHGNPLTRPPAQPKGEPKG